jgi:hypothetical protein
MKYAIIAAAILLAATSIADAKQWGRGNRPAPGIGRCGYNIALDCKGANKKTGRITDGQSRPWQPPR